MISVGQVAFLKTTDEPVFVLRLDHEDPAKNFNEFEQLAGTSVYVRRPTISGETIDHRLERYAIEELETREENSQRKIEWELSLRKQIKDANKADQTIGEATLDSLIN